MSSRTVRSLVIAALAVVAITVSASVRTQAQVHCPCPDVNVSVSSELTCRVHVCLVTPHGSIVCYTFAPGDVTTIPCIPGMQIVVVDGCDLRHNIVVGQCLYNLPGPAPCCVDVCLNVNEQGCLGLRFGRGNAGHCYCPGG